MTYELVDSGSGGGGSEYMTIYLYPNAPIDDALVEENPVGTGTVLLGAQEICEQCLSSDVIDSYYIYRSYEHPQLPAHDEACEHLSGSDSTDWSNYDGPNNRKQHFYSYPLYPGCHLLAYQSAYDANGCAEFVEYGDGAFSNVTDAVCITSGTEVRTTQELNQVIHEIAHTFIVSRRNSSDPTDYLGDGDDSDFVDHELGKIYSGWFGDGPASPMVTGYEFSDAPTEGNCSSGAYYNLSHDRSLTYCAKQAIEETAKQ